MVRIGSVLLSYSRIHYVSGKSISNRKALHNSDERRFQDVSLPHGDRDGQGQLKFTVT